MALPDTEIKAKNGAANASSRGSFRVCRFDGRHCPVHHDCTAAAQAPVGGRGMELLKLLVADDHEIVRKGLRSLLEAQPGWQVAGEASDGREAVEKAKDLKPDITVLDIGMPSLNG